MDLAGGTFVAQRAQGHFVTFSIDAMRFLRPISVGDEVSVYCTPHEEGDASVTVKIETWVQDRSDANPEKVAEGVFTCVTLDDDGTLFSMNVNRLK